LLRENCNLFRWTTAALTKTLGFSQGRFWAINLLLPRWRTPSTEVLQWCRPHSSRHCMLK